LSEELGNLLARVRDEATVTQRELAERLLLNQSKISRLEAGDGSADTDLYLKALSAIGTPKALTIAEAMTLPWEYLRQPSFEHSELAELISIERSLSKLSEFRTSLKPSSDLLGQVDLFFRRLQDAGAFLLKLEHQIGYVGEIGVGKTTALCKLGGLTIASQNPDDLTGMMLDTGGGRTTLCDVVVQKGDRYSFLVEPTPDEEVYRLAEELCRSVFEVRDSAQRTIATDYRPPEEIIRALRNMSGLVRTRADRNATFVDPLVTLASKARTLDELQVEFTSLLTLWRRTRTKIEFGGEDDSSGRRWFRETFTAINNGRRSDFSIPEKITATIPFSLIPNTSLNITLLDTRGLDGSSVRPDIISHLRNDRSITVLATKWGSAPDPSLQSLLKHIVETEVDRSIFERIVLMVIARSGDALSIKNDLGDYAEDVAEGYDLKIRQAQDALDRENLPQISMFSFNAAGDDVSDAISFLVSKVQALRKAQVVNAKATIMAVDQMLENAHQSRAVAAMREVNSELKQFAGQFAILKQDNSSVHRRLLRTLGGAHPRTIWASVRRKGSYRNFNFYQHLADGAAAEVKRRTAPIFHQLRDEIAADIDTIEYNIVRGFLEQLLEDVGKWEIDLSTAIRHYTISTYKDQMAQESIWRDLEEIYGTGAPFRENVVARFSAWFERNEGLSSTLNAKFQQAWRKSVIEPLLQTAGEID